MQRLRVNHLCRPRALALLIKTASIHLNLLMLRNTNMQPVRLAGGWWLVLVCSERRVLLAGCGWLPVAGSFWEKSTIVWWLISRANTPTILRTVPIKNDTPDVLIQSCVRGKNRNTRHHVLVVVVFHYTGARTTHGDSLVVTDRRPACAC
jgi:hypothetical protein